MEDGGHGDASAHEEENPKPHCCRGGDADAGMPGADAAIDAGADASAPCTPSDASYPAELCDLEGSQVVIVGDSYFARDPVTKLDSEPFRGHLETLARDAHALDSDEHYRDYSASYAFLTTNFATVPSVPTQYEQACREDPQVRLLILNGGGNDILVGNRRCLEYATATAFEADASCVTSIERATATASALLERAFQDGVQAAIFVWYGYFESSLSSGSHPNSFIDYAAPKFEAMCSGHAKGRCVFVDMRPVFDQDHDGRSDPDLVHEDGVHPTDLGSQRLAQAVWAEVEGLCSVEP